MMYDVDSTNKDGSLQVMDSLLNIGPCGDVAMGEPAFLSEEYDNSVDPCVELVTTSGHSKNGALSILQRSIKPQVLPHLLPGDTAPPLIVFILQLYSLVFIGLQAVYSVCSVAVFPILIILLVPFILIP